MVDRSRIAQCARGSTRVALVIFIAIMAAAFLRPLVEVLFGAKFQFNWVLGLKVSLVFSVLFFCVFFIWSWIAATRFQPVLDALDAEPLPSDLREPPLSGFVAMEYYWLILNRTFVVFVAPEGIYGWKAQGAVTNVDRTFYEPYQEMLKDDEFMRDRQAIEKLSRLRGGFFIERSAITTVEYNERQKWGVGGILHSGRINVKLSNGRTREFILLGFVIGDELINQMAATLGVNASNPVQV